MKWSKVLQKFVNGFVGVGLVAVIGAIFDFIGANGVNLVTELGLLNTIWGGLILAVIAALGNWWKHRNDPAPEAV